MMKRRSFSDRFKATVALEGLRGDKTAQEIAAKHKTRPTQVTTWKSGCIIAPPQTSPEKQDHFTGTQ